MFFQFQEHRPVVHDSAFVHPQATIIGNVIIGRKVYVGPGAVLRGDWGEIVIEDGCNVQENCVVHMFPGIQVRLMEDAHIGHGAIIHGATIGRNCLVGMNAVVMDEAFIGEESIVGALTFIKAGEKIPARSVVAGNPGKIIKQVSDEMLEWKSKGTYLYQELPAICRQDLRECSPLREIPDSRPIIPIDYKPWHKR